MNRSISSLGAGARRSAPGAALLAALLLALPMRAEASVASDVCQPGWTTGTTCNISGLPVVTVPSTLDFGNSAVVFKTGAILTLATGGMMRSVDILANSVTFEPNSRIFGNGDDAIVTITATAGDVTMQSSGSSISRINLSGFAAGYLSISASGRVVVDGLVDVSATGTDSSAGSVDITAGADVQIDRDIAAGAAG
ncbi:MAG: hypothetical protein ACKOCT_11680, partial [Alphaproteobacteria bacterium]